MIAVGLTPKEHWTERARRSKESPDFRMEKPGESFSSDTEPARGKVDQGNLHRRREREMEWTAVARLSAERSNAAPRHSRERERGCTNPKVPAARTDRTGSDEVTTARKRSCNEVPGG